MSRFSKALVALGAVSLVTTPVVASASGSTLPVSIVGTTDTKEGALGVVEILGITLVITALGVLVFTGGNSGTN